MNTNRRGMLDPDGPIARDIADLWWLMLALGTIAFLVFAAALVVALRRRDLDDDGPAPSSLKKLVVGGGVIFPAVVLTLTLIFTVVAMRAVPTRAPDNALVIELTGHQWAYEVHYPDEGVTVTDELHLPVGRPIELRLTSTDVIHSFWVPALAGKMDLLPDRVNTLVLEADEPGRHETLCAEFCGLHHADMKLVVIAEPATDFSEWLAANRR